MDKIITVAQVIVPIFVSVILGMTARRRGMMSSEEVRGLQSFVVKFALPCVVFKSCITAKINVSSLASMGLALAVVLLGCLWAFRWGKKKYPYHNFPMLFAAQETGMMGIPLFLILFGADQAYRMGVLDLTQAVVAYPVIAILSSEAGDDPTPGAIAKNVLTSPLMVMAALGLAMNFTGLANLLEQTGILGILTESTTFISTPISVLMLFSVGYNFSLEKECRGPVLKIAALRFGILAVAGVAVQLILCLIPGVDLLTRITMLMYCTLPTSYLAPGLGRNQEDYTVASGVCSILTVASLLVFCGIAAFVL